jgi:hypothetical protein
MAHRGDATGTKTAGVWPLACTPCRDIRTAMLRALITRIRCVTAAGQSLSNGLEATRGLAGLAGLQDNLHVSRADSSGPGGEPRWYNRGLSAATPGQAAGPEGGVRLTQLSHGGGCGCKIAPAKLAEILHKVQLDFGEPHSARGSHSEFVATP